MINSEGLMSRSLVLEEPNGEPIEFDHPWWMIAEGRPFHSITWEKPLNPYGNEPFSSHHSNFENEDIDRRAQRYTSVRPSGRERDIQRDVRPAKRWAYYWFNLLE